MGTKVNVNLNAETFSAIRQTDAQLYLQLVGRSENGWISQSAVGSVNSDLLAQWRDILAAAATFVDEQLGLVFNVNDMQKYARSEYSDNALDYFSLYRNTWLPTLQAAIDWIAAITPPVEDDPPFVVDTTDLTPLLQAIRTASE